VLPDQRGGDRDHEERRDHHRADEPAAEELPVEQDGDDQSQRHGDQHDRGGEDHGVDHRLPERRVGEHELVVVEEDELARPRLERVPRQRRDDERCEERQLRHHDHEDQGGEERRAARPPRLGDRRLGGPRTGRALLCVLDGCHVGSPG
jgi:hypothetical protein